MKYNITVEQLRELNEKQKRNLRKWWKPKYGDKIYISNSLRKINIVIKYKVYKFPEIYKEITTDNINCDTGYDVVEKGDCLPLLSIGQMLELLGEVKINPHETKTDVYVVEYKKSIMIGELCNCLWMATDSALINT